jgi:hypothetical protein
MALLANQARRAKPNIGKGFEKIEVLGEIG